MRTIEGLLEVLDRGAPRPLRRRRAAARQRLQPVPGRRTGALTLERPAVYGRRASSPLGPPGARPESRAPSPRTSKEEGHDVCAGRDLTTFRVEDDGGRGHGGRGQP